MPLDTRRPRTRRPRWRSARRARALRARAARLRRSRSCVPRRRAATSSPLRARRIAEALQGMRALGRFSGAGGAVQAGQEHRAESCRPSAGRSTARRWPSRPSARCSTRSMRGGPGIEAAAARSDYRARLRRNRRPSRRPSTGSSPKYSSWPTTSRVRTARLTLMADLRDLILHLADISEIVPQTE